MRAGWLIRSAMLTCVVGALAACDANPNKFDTKYNAARTALEKGKYERASRLYGELIKEAGPYAGPIRLEYTHALLRAGDYAGASKHANYLASNAKDQDRSAALSVYAVAEHELGLAAIDAGDLTTARTHLKAADAAIHEVLRKYPKLDPIGTLAQRRKDIKSALKSV